MCRALGEILSQCFRVHTSRGCPPENASPRPPHMGSVHLLFCLLWAVGRLWGQVCVWECV